MTLRADSYGSVNEVQAFTQHLLSGQESYNQHTRPTLAQVEKFIDRASGILNLALASNGATTPVTNSTAKLAMDDWVVARSVEYVELTQRGVGYAEPEGSRVVGFRNLHASANKFVEDMLVGLKEIGVTIGKPLSEGLSFTGLDAVSERADPDDTSLAQPLFRRGLFDSASPWSTEDENE